MSEKVCGLGTQEEEGMGGRERKGKDSKHEGKRRGEIKTGKARDSNVLGKRERAWELESGRAGRGRREVKQVIAKVLTRKVESDGESRLSRLFVLKIPSRRLREVGR